MSCDTAPDVTGVWQEVRQWPPRQRLALATRILQSLEQDTAAGPVAKGRADALTRLIGIWKTENPPTEEEVRQMVEEERAKKYG
jgi:hypothetical protein